MLFFNVQLFCRAVLTSFLFLILLLELKDTHLDTDQVYWSQCSPWFLIQHENAKRQKNPEHLFLFTVDIKKCSGQHALPYINENHPVSHCSDAIGTWWGRGRPSIMKAYRGEEEGRINGSDWRRRDAGHISIFVSKAWRWTWLTSPALGKGSNCKWRMKQCHRNWFD